MFGLLYVYANIGFEVQNKASTFCLLLLLKDTTRVSITVSIVDDALLGPSRSSGGV